MYFDVDTMNVVNIQMGSGWKRMFVTVMALKLEGCYGY